MTYIVASEKPWHKEMLGRLQQKMPEFSWVLIDKKEDLNDKNIRVINPLKIFFPHWSYVIPSLIYAQFECVVFHMTDLPYGRGGSPLQNLIVRGYKTTKISALRVEKGIDEGPVYLKKPLSLEGTAKEILIHCSDVIEEMIWEIIAKNCQPQEQVGAASTFKRRTPNESSIAALKDMQQVYDYIRMLDADGYPHAFLDTENFRFEFTNASLLEDQTITANVRIIKK